MNYSLVEINNKNKWNDFVMQNDFDFYSFLSSWEWGEFQVLAGKKIFRFGIFNSNEQVGQVALIKNQAKRGTYLFAPHNPLIKKGVNFFEVIEDILPKLKELAKNEKADFIRLNSPITNSTKNKKSFEKLGFKDAPMHEHAEDTHLLNLSINEDELLSNIKKDDRYYINRAIKEGVEIKIGNDKEHIDVLSHMHNEHSKKVGYHAFKDEFIRNLYEVFSNENITTISASFNGQVESILMTIKYGRTVVYYIAASDIVSHKFSPNYLCQWEAIKHAKQNGALIYNFWGVSPDNNPKHPIAGVTKFKRKFGGYDYSLLHAQDLPITRKYWLNCLIENIRRKKRGYYYKPPEDLN